MISGKYLPALSLPSGNSADQPRLDQSRSALPRHNDSQQQERQQTIEYIFRGDVEDALFSQNQKRQQGHQQIDPARRSAIFSYTDTQTLSIHNAERQGRLLDIFI